VEVTYQDLRLEGWDLKVESSVIRQHKPAWQMVREELRKQLFQITRVVAPGPLAKLRKVTVWIHWTSPETTCMAYHPGAQWLREHKMNPTMEKGIEIGNATNFLSWTYEQPWMVLHELAHAYHDRFLTRGFENTEVKQRWAAAVKEKRFDSVLHWDGKSTKHYAATNQMEFFAESSEAYFGQNDFYPFVRAELKVSDPETFSLMEAIWGPITKRG